MNANTSVKYGIDSASWKRTTTCWVDASLQRLLSGCDRRRCGYWKGLSVYSELLLNLFIQKCLLIGVQHPNQEWSQRLSEIQANHIQRNNDGSRHERGAFRVNRNATNGSRRTRSFIPEVHTFNAKEVSSF